jgi:hypothetical protein
MFDYMRHGRQPYCEPRVFEADTGPVEDDDDDDGLVVDGRLDAVDSVLLL